MTMTMTFFFRPNKVVVPTAHTTTTTTTIIHWGLWLLLLSSSWLLLLLLVDEYPSSSSKMMMNYNDCHHHHHFHEKDDDDHHQSYHSFLFLSGVCFGILFSFLFFQCIVPWFQYYCNYYYCDGDDDGTTSSMEEEQQHHNSQNNTTTKQQQHPPPQTYDDNNNNNQHSSKQHLSWNEKDESLNVLQGALDLVNRYSCDDDDDDHSSDSNNNNNNNTTTTNTSIPKKKDRKVVEFLSPQQIWKQLFSSSSSTTTTTYNYSTSLSLLPLNNNNNNNNDNDNDDDNATSLSNTTTTTNTTTMMKSKDFVELLRKIQYYSVDTSHKLFFNQLFGAVDPVSMAAEIVALSLNTSNYTFETAPIFTMMERHVLHTFGSFLYNHHNSNTTTNQQQQQQEEEESIINNTTTSATGGLFLPGGSLSNLTALHVARYSTLRHYHNKPYNNNNNNNKNNNNKFTNTTTNINNAINNNTINNNKQLPEFELDQQPSNNNISTYSKQEEEEEEEKKIDEDCNNTTTETIETMGVNNNDNDNDDEHHHHLYATTGGDGVYDIQNRLVAFVSKEAHYSFVKSMNIIGFHKEFNLVVIPCLENGQMDVFELAKAIRNTQKQKKKQKMMMIPFFVGITSGSTVRGSFDDIPSIVQVCTELQTELQLKHKIWIHVDAAWGGAALFSKHYRSLLFQNVHQVDSFTFNPHKLLGAPQQTSILLTKKKDILMEANATSAKYLFDKRKVGAEYDMGDASYTCGRRTDVIKFWSMWKYYGLHGLGQRVDSKIQILKHMAQTIRNHPSFLLVDEWPFNINFFYLPQRIRQQIQNYNNNNNNNNDSTTTTTTTFKFPLNEKNTKLPMDIYKELSKIAVQLKTRLHKAGVMLIPFQPLNGLDADCFRIVLAGKKEFTKEDCKRVIDLMEQYGDDL